MLDLRLPYFYNLPLAILLTMSAASRLDGVLVAVDSWNLDRMANWAWMDNDALLYLKLLLITMPAMMGAAYFAKQFYERNDVYVRETMFILGVINFLGYLIPAFLR